MTLIKYSRPRRNIAGRQFSDIMDDFFNEAVATTNSSFTPDINISETEDKLSIDVDIPGMKKEDIQIGIENGALTISGERKNKSEEDGRTFHRVETHYGTFERSFQLPENVDEDSIEATYSDGVLHIDINKKEEKLKKQIEIK
ncbi:Hsp20/alpha crystallin family protein [Rhodohalobacter sp. 8-1]|uniref:Hsp20/alpha crystallin family protein n=1 Tax=Rhodohalobacter sp. 8-1 TaxID=3131972 RepID=UPI0030EC96DF